MKIETETEARQLEKETGQFFTQLNALNISVADINRYKNKSAIADVVVSIFVAIIGFPLALFGAINHLLPYLLAGFATQKLTPRPDFTGSLRLAAGTFGTIIFYVIQSVGCYLISGSSLITAVYMASLPVSGLFCIMYFEWLKNISGRVKLHKLKIFNRKKFNDLFATRDAIFKNIISLQNQL